MPKRYNILKREREPVMVEIDPQVNKDMRKDAIKKKKKLWEYVTDAIKRELDVR